MGHVGAARASLVLGDVRFNQLYPKAGILDHLDQHGARLGGTIGLSEVWPEKPPVFWLDSDRDDAVFHPLQAHLFSVPDSYAEEFGRRFGEFGELLPIRIRRRLKSWRAWLFEVTFEYRFIDFDASTLKGPMTHRRVVPLPGRDVDFPLLFRDPERRYYRFASARAGGLEQWLSDRSVTGVSFDRQFVQGRPTA